MYQNTVSAGAQSARATSKFGKLVRFVAGTAGFSALICGALPQANAQTYYLSQATNISYGSGSNTNIRIGGTNRPTAVLPNPGHTGPYHDAWDVSGTLTLGGTGVASPFTHVNFTVLLQSGFQPAPGDDFHIFNYANIGGSSTTGGFMPPANAPRYINYNLPALSEDYYVWVVDWSIPNQMWFRVEGLENQVGLNITSHGINHGTAVVTGSNGNYIPGIVTILPPPGENDGHISIDGPFPEAGPPGELWVLADLEGYTDLLDFMTNLTLFDDSPLFTYEMAGETNFDAMVAKFGSDWEVLLKFQGLPAGATGTNMRINWSFQRDDDVTVERLLVIPEPATMFVCVAGIFGMMTYRPGRMRRAA